MPKLPATTWLDAFLGTFTAIRYNGPRRTLRQILTIDQPRVGTLVGRDEAGNSYYENREDIVLRDRWVEYKSWNPDASQVPAEWHQWLHRITDEVPNPENIPRPFFSPPHIENLTGSTGAFKTYNTTVPKYNSWTPGTKARQG